MGPGSWGQAVARLARSARRPTDGELLGRYHRHRDEAAFAALVDRHAGLVWGVAVRRAADRHAAEDAFQATFLALARRAGRLRGDACVAGWLHTVAARAAARTRRRSHVLLAAEPLAPAADPLDTLSAREMLAVIDDELARLPDRYRLPLLLCGLDGLSREEAAARLGWTGGAVRGRLERGRELLRKRLTRRGVAAGAVLVGGPAVPAGLAAATVAAVRAPSAAVAALAAPTRWPLLAGALVAVVVGAGAGAGLRPAAADPPPAAGPGVTVRVTADGKPAAGAKVWVQFGEGDKGPPPAAPSPTVADAAGVARVPLPPAPAETWRRLYAFAEAAGRVGAWEFDRDRAETDGTVKLQPAVEFAGRLLEPDGGPVVGAKLAVRGCSVWAPERDEFYDRERNFPIPRWHPSRRPVTTDAAGRFLIPGLPAGYGVVFDLDTAAHGRGIARHRLGSGDVLTLPKGGAVTLRLTGPADRAKGMEVWLRQADRRGGTLWVNASRTVTLDGSARFTESNLPAGEYEVRPSDGKTAVFATPKPNPVTVPPGGQAAVELALETGVKAGGRLLGPDGKPLAGGSLSFRPANPAGRSQRWLTATTDADGRYTAYLPTEEAWRVYVQTPPTGYLAPKYVPESGAAPDQTAVVGKELTFADITLRKAVRLSGVVVDAAGKPVPGAVVYPESNTGVTSNPLTTGPDGRFTITGLDPEDQIRPRARSGDAVNAPETFDIGTVLQPVKLVVAADKGRRLEGRVADAAGAAVAGAKVEVQWYRQQVGSRKEYGTLSRYEVVTTDADGRYRSSNLWASDRYTLKVTADGFSPGEVSFQGVMPADGVIRLTRMSGTVRGTVVGLDGKPVGGATVFSRGDADNLLETKSAADGSFALTGYREAPGFVQAKKAGHRLAVAPADPGGPAVRLVLRTAADPPAPAPDLTGHRAALDALARELLEKLWAKRGDDRPGRLIEGMALLDPEQAKRWAAEAKVDPARYLPAPDLLPLARTDPAAAVAKLPAAGFRPAVKLARKLVADHPDAARTLLDAALANARKLKEAERAAALAECAWLARRLGRDEQAKGLAAEAVPLATALPADEKGVPSVYRGYAAGYLAAVDPAAADALLAGYAPDGHDRYLARAVDAVAAVDPGRAKGLLDRFRAAGHFDRYEARVYYACRVAKADPDGAREAVQGIDMGTYRVLGLAQLAAVTAAFDKPRAWALIDAALAVCRDDPGPFRSSQSSGGASGAAAAVARRAVEVGHPDMATAVATVVAARPLAADVSSLEERERAVLSTALALSFTGPEAARRLLAGTVPPAEQATRAERGGREWMFAAALLDPGTAVAAADRRLAYVRRTPAMPSYYGGFSELVGTLAARGDRYPAAAGWTNMPKFNNEWEE